jgi:hypothetical protein
MSKPNIFWIDALYESRPIRIENKTYLATLSNGQEAVVYWHGSGTDARIKLDAASVKWRDKRIGLARDVIDNMPDLDSIIDMAIELLAAEYGRRLSRYREDYDNANDLEGLNHEVTIDSIITDLEDLRDNTQCLGCDAKRCGCERFDYVLDRLRDIKHSPVEVSDGNTA